MLGGGTCFRGYLWGVHVPHPPSLIEDKKNEPPASRTHTSARGKKWGGVNRKKTAPAPELMVVEGRGNRAVV